MFLPPMIRIVTRFLFVFINLARFSLTIYLRIGMDIIVRFFVIMYS